MSSCTQSKSIRFEDDLESATSTPPPHKRGKLFRFSNENDGAVRALGFCSKKTNRDGLGIPLQRELSRVFSEDYETVDQKTLDPRGPAINQWNKLFLVACLVSLFVDPLFFYLQGVRREDMCMDMSSSLEVALTVIRSLADAFYMVQIYIRLQTAYVAPSSRVFGRGELVIDPSKIASRYLRCEFWLDLLASVPLPQLLLWAAIPDLKGSSTVHIKCFIRFVVIFQYLLRLYLIFPLSSEITKNNGVVTETAWAGAAYNLMLFMLASHVLGSCWYLLSIEHQEQCWRNVCGLERAHCYYEFLDCRSTDWSARVVWLQSSNISSLCDPNSRYYGYGIYADALSGVTTSRFFNKYFYCFWWGLRNLSSLGQNLQTGTNVGDIAFAILIVILGLVLFALLIGNMERYLQSTSKRLEEWRVWRTDTERWMHHRQLPHELKQSVRNYDQYHWVTTRGVDEEAILKGLPVDLRRDIKRHLCFDLVCRVPLFDQMDDRMLDAICERLKPALCTQGTCLVREGDLVTEMLFIIRGHLESHTTNGGQTGFFNTSCIGPGDFCGEELLTWALDPRPSVILPTSTRTVEAIGEVEAFALKAEDLKFVAAQYRRLHSKQLRQTFRFYSHQWRTWGACFIQAAWFSFKRRKQGCRVKDKERLLSQHHHHPMAMEERVPARSMPLTATLRTHVAKSSASARWDGRLENGILSSLVKPEEPDFAVDEE